MRSTDVQICPALANAPIAACSAAHSGSTPASTTIASLPPSSSSALPSRPAHAARHLAPASGPSPCGPRGRRAGARRAGGRRARRRGGAGGRRRAGRAARRAGRRDSGVFSDGLKTTVLPVTSAAAIWPQAIATGSFQGTSSATTPRGSCTIRSAASQPPCSARPRCSGPSSAYCSIAPMPGLDAAERVAQRLAALAGLQLGELRGVLAQAARGGLEDRAALGRARSAPRPAGRRARRARRRRRPRASRPGSRPSRSPVAGSSTSRVAWRRSGPGRSWSSAPTRAPRVSNRTRRVKVGRNLAMRWP